MNPKRYSITFACYNSVEYTKMCIESMQLHNTPLNRVVAVDNASHDATRTYIESIPLGEKIYNQGNLGCGTAWNQGILAQQAEWSIIMNNDVLVSPQWIENLITAAENLNVRVISPALIEGPLDYDFDAWVTKNQPIMKDVHRLGARHLVCLAVHESVWKEVGYFQPVPKLLGYEDTLFFRELDKAQISSAITGASWLHHFGSITQTAMKQERGLRENEGLGYRYNYKLLQQSWLERKYKKWQRKQQERNWRLDELKQYGMTLHGIRQNQNFEWL